MAQVSGGRVIAFLTTTDPVKLSAAEALLTAAGVAATVFDRAAGTLWTAIIPMRLMIDGEDAGAAKTALMSRRVDPSGRWRLGSCRGKTSRSGRLRAPDGTVA